MDLDELVLIKGSAAGLRPQNNRCSRLCTSLDDL
jgi:hypothetical protein